MTNREAPVLTVDGPSGTGKGTLCQKLAERLGWRFLDSGAIYRALALKALEEGIDLGAEQALAECAETLALIFALDHARGQIKTLLDGRDVSAAIRTEECSAAASKIAALPLVRAALLDRQRAFRQEPGLVADGRDMGTVVFPDARYKVFLTASQEERARRRHKQLKEKGNSVTLPQLLADIVERDKRDCERSVAPLQPARDAVVIDTTKLAIDEVERRVLALMGRA